MPIPRKQGDHRSTSADYWSLPESQRAELIDGVLYDMTPPGRVHQKLIGELYFALSSYVKRRNGNCEVYFAPIAVNLNADDSTWVEPDVIVVCDPSKLSDRGCEGAPDLVIEVVSPSSQRMDYIRKTYRYEHAGVREYWIVDPAVQATVVYRFEEQNDTEPTGEEQLPLLRSYPFGEPIPVGIWQGEGDGDGCVIVVGDLIASRRA